jgi:methanogenic corrinoid protein MtbC1
VIGLRAYGFSVEELGANVTPKVLADRNRSWRPDIIGLSGLMTVAYDAMRDTLQLLPATARAQAVPLVPILIVGGVS